MYIIKVKLALAIETSIFQNIITKFLIELGEKLLAILFTPFCKYLALLLTFISYLHIELLFLKITLFQNKGEQGNKSDISGIQEVA